MYISLMEWNYNTVIHISLTLFYLCEGKLCLSFLHGSFILEVRYFMLHFATVPSIFLNKKPFNHRYPVVYICRQLHLDCPRAVIIQIAMQHLSLTCNLYFSFWSFCFVEHYLWWFFLSLRNANSMICIKFEDVSISINLPLRASKAFRFLFLCVLIVETMVVGVLDKMIHNHAWRNLADGWNFMWKSGLLL